MSTFNDYLQDIQLSLEEFENFDPETKKGYRFMYVDWLKVRRGIFAMEKVKFSWEIISSGHHGGNFLHVTALPATFYARYPDIPIYIYIRKCYERLYEIASDMMNSHETGRFPVALLTGVPGIGKSLFMIYFIFRYLHDERFPDKRFVVLFAAEDYEIFTPTADTSIFEYTNVNNAQKSMLLELPIFSDIAAPMEPRCRGKWTFIFSSPNPLRYKEILKCPPNFKYTLPTWSDSELECLRPDDVTVWFESFILFGGVPRYVFWNGKNIDPKHRLEEAIRAKGGVIADYFFSYSFGGLDTDTSYLLLHINPPRCPDSDDWLYDGLASLSFASDEIFKRISNMHSNRLFAESMNIYNAGISALTFGAVSAGHLFEKICLWLKPLAGQSISVISLLFPGQEYGLVLPPMRLLDYTWKKRPAGQLVPDLLYQPRISNMESGDAFALLSCADGSASEYMLVVLQITVGASHPIKINGLHDILLAYFEEIQERIVRKLLVFITPLDGKLNSLQPLHTQGGKVARDHDIPILVRGFEQCFYRHKLK